MPALVFIRSASVATQQQRSDLIREETVRWTGRPAETISVARAPSGAPRLTVSGKDAYASFSCRHDAALIGLAEHAIGVDLEEIGESVEPPWNVLAASERATLSAIVDRHARHLAFLHLWTTKEAVLKALRVGLSREPASVAVSFDPSGSPVVRVDDTKLSLHHAATGDLTDGSARFVWSCVLL